MIKVLLSSNTSWYLYNYRTSFAKFLQNNGYIPIFVAPEDQYTKKIKEEGFRFIQIDLQRKSTNPFTEWNLIHQFESTYQNEQPDIVHHHTAKPVIYGSFASKKFNIPTVNSITGLGYAFSSKTIKAQTLKPIILALYKRAMLNHKHCSVIHQNLANMEYFLNHDIGTRENSYYIPGSGAEKDKFYPDQNRSVAFPPIVIFPTRMLWDKGVGVFANAAKILKDRKIVCRMVLVGSSDEGNPNAIPHETITKWVAHEILEWWGWRSDMRTVYNECDLLVYPSFSEGLPRTLVEAALCEKAIIASAIPGCRDIIQHRENGLLIPPRNSMALAESIEELLLDKKLRIKFGRNARESALKHFEHQVIAVKTMSVYENLLSQK
ncbi:MAG: glycosyltransferase family 4 protein [Anaerolineaceae bacterium]|nr:glycosyltransferase family 4 protein [Anaerolineaceae bacterium]